MGEEYNENFIEDENFIELFESIKFFQEHELTVKSKKEFDTIVDFMAS